MRFPPLLAAGARVALLSPAGPIRDTDLERAEANARRFGWEPVVATSAQAADGYLAGSDEQRARRTEIIKQHRVAWFGRARPFGSGQIGDAAGR